jgi:hypothetical protein
MEPPAKSRAYFSENLSATYKDTYTLREVTYNPTTQSNEISLEELPPLRAIDWAKDYPNTRMLALQYGMIAKGVNTTKYCLIVFRPYGDNDPRYIRLAFNRYHENGWISLLQAIESNVAPILTNYFSEGKVQIIAKESSLLFYLRALNEETFDKVTEFVAYMLKVGNYKIKSKAIKELQRLQYDIQSAVNTIFKTKEVYNTLTRSATSPDWNSKRAKMLELVELIEDKVQGLIATLPPP